MRIGTHVGAGVAGSPCASARGSAPHIGVFLKKKVLWVVCIAMVALLPGQVRAQTATMESLQTQIRELQRQLDTLKEQVRQSQAAPAPVSAPPQAAVEKPKTAAPGGGKVLYTNTDVKLTLGGFIEAAGIYRDRFTGSDVNSRWNLGAGGFPLQNSPNYYTNEVRGTARQSRLSLLAQGQEDYASLAAYFEFDFLGGGSGTSGNSQESNSYNPRIRHLYATYDTKSGWHLLAGQSWSLITMDKAGIVPRQEYLPIVIDSQYVPGFTWTRNPQIRLVKDFGSTVSAGLSLEAPQAIFTAGGLTAGPAGSANANYTVRLINTANFADVTGTANSSNMPGSLTLDQYPDIAGKIAFDPGFGHYEVYGVGRFFTDRTLVNGSRDNNTTFGWGAGGAVLLPVVPKLLDFQGSFLAGRGIGRYGSAGFPDVVVNPLSGKLDPLSEVEALAGLVAHPTNRLDIYGYAGFEQVARKDVVGTTGGFGNAAYAPAGLITEGSSASSALVQAAAVEQGTLGGWYSFYKGNYGLMRVGLQYAYTKLRIFNLPNESINSVFVSLRYYPF